jgi:acetyl esterase/lipase
MTNKNYWLKSLFVIMLLLASQSVAYSQNKEDQIIELINQKFDDLRHRLDQIDKAIDDLAWFNRLGDVAYIDKVLLQGHHLTGLKIRMPWVLSIPSGSILIFLSRVILTPQKNIRLLVLPHGGVHGDFDTYYTHIVREMMAQQYIVVAPEYRGSTGYGRRTFEAIDYGGLENQDVKASRDYMVENYEFVDSKRVGIIGWSHGGMIALMNIFEYPKEYQVAFAGVPVSDLVARMGYATDSYRRFFQTTTTSEQLPARISKNTGADRR